MNINPKKPFRFLVYTFNLIIIVYFCSLKSKNASKEEQSLPHFKVKKMTTIRVKDKNFKPYLSQKEIFERIENLAERINFEMKDTDPLFVCVLNGAFMFASDLIKRITIDCEITFIRLKSYSGIQSTGEIEEVLGLNANIENRTIVLIEDIVDTGQTLKSLIDKLELLNPKVIKTVSLLVKPDAVQCDLNIDYVAFEIPNDFIVGYGLDYDGYGRNLNDIYVIC